MADLDRGRVLQLLLLLTVLLFLAGNMLPAPWRARLRTATIGLYAGAVLLALAAVALWLAG